MKRLMAAMAFVMVMAGMGFAADYSLKIPAQIISAKDKTEFAYRKQELLRLIHNFVGYWYREGITLDEYNTLPNFIKTRISYVPKLTKTQWNWFLDNVFEPRSLAISNAILAAREVLKQSAITNNIDLGADFETSI